MEGTEMISTKSRATMNRFCRDSINYGATYIHPQIIHKLKILNATIRPKIHSFHASVPGYYVEWFYNTNTATYGFISGATNSTVFRNDGDLDSLCSEFERMFGYDV
jgi:hypothetical protein